jgi:hypothetical protein
MEIVMATANKSTHRSLVTLRLPKSVPGLIVYAQNIVKRMTDNPSFPNPAPTLAAVTAATTSCEPPKYPRSPTWFAMGPGGEALFAGTSGKQGFIVRDWFAGAGPSGPLFESISGDGLGGALIAMSSSGVPYVGRSVVVPTFDPVTNFRNGQYVGGEAQRANTSFQIAWTNELPGPAAGVVPLKDSAVYFRSSVMTRIDAGGQTVATWALSDAFADSAETSDLEADVLTSSASGYTLSHLVFAPLLSPSLAAGSPCEDGTQCTMGRCCFAGGSAVGKCASRSACDFPAECQSASDCSGGTCYKPPSSGTGICTQNCTTSSACAGGAYCIAASNTCLPGCLTGGTLGCLLISPALGCMQSANTENLMVSVCQ